MAVKLIARKQLGKTKKGDEFSAPAHIARALVALGHAQRAVVAEPAPAEAPRTKRGYKRRDMVAEHDTLKGEAPMFRYSEYVTKGDV